MFSESAQLSIREVRDWADEEARWADDHVHMVDAAVGEDLKEVHRQQAAKHQARARWLYEVLANATVDREKT